MLRPGRAHDHEGGATPLDLGPARDQASDLLAAEDSAEVADEGEHHRALGPEPFERHRGAALVEQGEAGEGAGEQIVHGVHCNRPAISLTMRDMRGYGGRVLFVDVTDGRSRIEAVSDEMARGLLGGNGFAARLLLDHVPSGADAYDPVNAVVFSVGPITDRSEERRVGKECRL